MSAVPVSAPIDVLIVLRTIVSQSVPYVLGHPIPYISSATIVCVLGHAVRRIDAAAIGD